MRLVSGTGGIARRVLRWCSVSLGVGVILLAVSLGAFRLFAARLPTYKEDVQDWVAAELGLLLNYDTLDLRLTLTGPRLELYGATVASEDPSRPFVLARVADITLDVFELLLERRFTPTQLTVEGIEIAIERTAAGDFRIEGVPTDAAGAPSFDFEIPRSVRLVVRDSRLSYDDQLRDIHWAFENVAVSVEQTADAIEMNATATPPPTLAARVEISVDGQLGARGTSESWRGFATIRDADLAALTALHPPLAMVGGQGDVSVWVETEAARLTSVLAEVSLEDVAVDDSPAGRFDRLALTGEWSRMDSGWTLALNDVVLTHDGVDWPRRGNTVVEWSTAEGVQHVRTDYLRLEDLSPVIARLPPSALRERWLAAAPSGELRDFEFRTETASEDEFEISGEFAEIGLAGFAALPALSGLSGSLRADARGGTIRLDSDRAVMARGELFGRELVLDHVTGLVLWRRGRAADRLVSDDLTFELFGGRVSSSFDLSVPRDGGSVRLDLETRIGDLDIAAIKPYIVAVQPREVVATWLDRALIGGHVDSAEIAFFGPVDAFPFDRGEGQFVVGAEVRGGVLDYIEDWPRVEGFDGRVEFVNASFLARGRARVLGNVSDNVVVTIDNLQHDSTLSIAADTTGPLSDFLQFLLDAPQIARFLGPGYSQLSAPEGIAKVRLDLSLPLPVEPAYELSADLEIVDGTLSFTGLVPGVSDVDGFLYLREGEVTGQNISASFLDGPILAQVVVPQRPGYRAEINVDGEVTADAVLAAFDLPYRDQLAGQTRWRGRMLLPNVAAAGDQFASPVIVETDANLSGLALRFPEPFDKPPRDATNLHLEFAFGAGDDLDVAGNLGATRHFVGSFSRNQGRTELLRGRLSFGETSTAPLPSAGLEIVGTLPRIDLDAWRNLIDSTARSPRAADMLRRVDLDVADLSGYGQSLGPSRIQATLEAPEARIQVDSEPFAGVIRFPVQADGRTTIEADLERLFLNLAAESGSSQADPRRLPGLDVTIEDFRVGTRHLGRIDALVEPDPLGLRLAHFTSDSAGFHAEGSGAWLSGGARESESRLAFSMSSTDVGAALGELGFDPVIEGQNAELTASLHWPGGPSAEWMSRLNGDISLRVDKGSMLDIEPGAGRIVGLMSIVALPRRLALDFRDVFNRGFAFDEITAEFKLIDGNAYTDNLMLSGPAAEIGVVGRTGLRDRDFRQQAVVTAEPSKMLPTVGGLIAGPGVGAALLIFTRIFKKPLRGLGRVAYCITGSWEDPSVVRLTAEQLASNELCAELPPQWADDALVESSQ